MTVLNILNQEIFTQGIVKMTIQKTSVQNFFIEKQLSSVRTNRELHETDLAGFPLRKIFPLGKKSPSGEIMLSGKSCQLNNNDFHEFKQ